MLALRSWGEKAVEQGGIIGIVQNEEPAPIRAQLRFHGGYSLPHFMRVLFRQLEFLSDCDEI